VASINIVNFIPPSNLLLAFFFKEFLKNINFKTYLIVKKIIIIIIINIIIIIIIIFIFIINFLC
jgi:hypothetical protein